jgi:hypothetical protein
VGAIQRKREFPLERTLTRLRSVPHWFHHTTDFFQFPDVKGGKKAAQKEEVTPELEKQIEEEIIADT